jgi:hypothetical protein
MQPDIRYAQSSGAAIAYQVIGNADTDLVFVPDFGSNLIFGWQSPHWRDFYERLARTFRLILFDKRGSGARDPLRTGSGRERARNRARAARGRAHGRVRAPRGQGRGDRRLGWCSGGRVGRPGRGTRHGHRQGSRRRLGDRVRGPGRARAERRAGEMEPVCSSVTWTRWRSHSSFA